MALAPSNAPMPAWLATRIMAGGDRGPRYEASLYGPINTLLAWRFPPEQQFMVKPQGKIRPHYATDASDLEEGLSRLSLDSYRSEVLPRDMGGWEDGVKIPDFMVIKAGNTLNSDRILAIVEVKPLNLGVSAALGKLGEYLEMF